MAAKRASVAPGRLLRIDEACREVMSNVEGALACAVVDLRSGKLLGCHSAQRTLAFEEALAAATFDLFHGGVPDQEVKKAVQEVHVMSADNHHFAKVLKGGRAAVMLVTSRATTASMGSAQMRVLIPTVEPHVP